MGHPAAETNAQKIDHVQQSSDIFITQVIDIERHFLGRAGLGALRPEAKLLFLINQRGSLSVKQAMSVSDLSDRGSYTLLNGLSSQGPHHSHRGRCRQAGEEDRARGQGQYCRTHSGLSAQGRAAREHLLASWLPTSWARDQELSARPAKRHPRPPTGLNRPSPPR